MFLNIIFQDKLILKICIWQHGKSLQVIFTIYKRKKCFMGSQLTGPVNTSEIPVFTGKQGFIALVFVNTKFCKYKFVIQVCNYKNLYFS